MSKNLQGRARDYIAALIEVDAGENASSDVVDMALQIIGRATATHWQVRRGSVLVWDGESEDEAREVASRSEDYSLHRETWRQDDNGLPELVAVEPADL